MEATDVRLKKPETPRQLATALAAIAEQKKATDIVIYHVLPLIGITDFFVVCTAQSAPQLKAIAKEVARVTKSSGLLPYGAEGSPDSGWVLVDYSDVVLHIFNRETREYYDFDLLWGDAQQISWPPDRRDSPKD